MCSAVRKSLIKAERVALLNYWEVRVAAMLRLPVQRCLLQVHGYFHVKKKKKKESILRLDDTEGMSKLEHSDAACGGLTSSSGFLLKIQSKIMRWPPWQKQGQSRMENKPADVSGGNRCIFTHST